MLSRLIMTALFVLTVPAFSQKRPLPANPGKVFVLVDATGSPGSLVQLIQTSRLIVDANVLTLLPSLNTSHDPDRPVLLTFSIVGVNEILAGSIPNSSPNILLEQTGGQLGGWDIEARGDPVVKPGERHILFLIPDNRTELPNTTGLPRYAAVGVWAGNIQVANGKIAISSQSRPNLRLFNGQDVDVFLQNLRETIMHPYTDPNAPINGLPHQ